MPAWNRQWNRKTSTARILQPSSSEKSLRAAVLMQKGAIRRLADGPFLYIGSQNCYQGISAPQWGQYLPLDLPRKQPHAGQRPKSLQKIEATAANPMTSKPNQTTVFAVFRLMSYALFFVTWKGK